VRYIVMAMMIVAVTTPASAQFKPNMLDDGKKMKTQEEVKAQEERENSYKAGVSKIPDQKGKTDPWGGVRSSSTPQTTQKQGQQGSK